MTESSHVTAIILAAGRSRRFDKQNKLRQILNGGTVIEKTLERAAASPVDELIVVTGFQTNQFDGLFSGLSPGGLEVRSVFNADFETGMASSIVRGVEAAAPNSHFLIWPGDMPFITAKTGTEVVQPGGGENIVVPVFEGRRGHPVFFGRFFREELLMLEGDRGARSILDRHPESIIEVEVADPGVVFDVDTDDDLAVAMKILSGRS